MKRKILLISCKGLGKGGVQAVLMGIVRNLSSKYIFDIILFTSQEGYYEEEFKSFGGRIFRILGYEGKNHFFRKADYFLRKYRIYRKVKRCIQENGPYCAIHCNNYLESSYCLRASYECKVPVRISHIHGIIPPSPSILTTIENKERSDIKKYANFRIACSDIAYISAFGNESEPRVVVNAYDDKRFNRASYFCQKTKYLSITQIGYFCTNKNQLFSINVVYHIKKAYPEVRLNLVGFDVDGHKLELERTIEELGLQDNVHFYPSDTDTPELLSKSHIALVPSHSEGFGIVAVEAQAMGAYVFASDALPKTTDAGGCTYLPLDLGAQVWADYIVQWYDKNKDIPQDYDCSAFEEPIIMEQYKRIYEGLE